MRRFPHLIDGARWTSEGESSYLLTHPVSGRSLRMGRLEHLILTALDGEIPPSELARNLGMTLGRPISEASMTAVLQRLAEQGFVELPARPGLEVLPGARVRCCASGHCCHLGVGPLTALEQRRLRSLPWEQAGEQPPEEPIFREGDGVYIRQRDEDAACIFLEEGGACRIHRVFGYEVKPAICRLFPVFTVDVGGTLRCGVSFDCPGACLAGPEDRLVDELSLAGELLAATRLFAAPPGLYPEDGAEPEDPEAAVALEARMLRALRDPGLSPEAALIACAREVLGSVEGGLSEGASLDQWLGALHGLVREQLEALASPYYTEQMARLERLFRTLLGGGREASPGRGRSPALDDLFRRVWSNYVFTRHHLFRFGQVAGVAILMLLHRLAVIRLDELGAELPPGEALEQVHGARAIPEALVLLRTLEVVERLPGTGALVLRGFIADLSS